jgi:hypothetical protein
MRRDCETPTGAREHRRGCEAVAKPRDLPSRSKRLDFAYCGCIFDGLLTLGKGMQLFDSLKA